MASNIDQAPLAGTVVVTGAAGYLGSVLIRKLLARGWRVIGFDRLIYGGGALSELEEGGRFRMIPGDVRSPGGLLPALSAADALVHLAAIVGDPACALDESAAIDVNVAATASIVQAARRYRLRRLVFASSCAVYGASGEIVDETSPINPLSLYARSKAAAENVVLNAGGLPATVLRFATLYGMSPRPRLDLLVNLFAAQAAQCGEITVMGGRQWRPLLHVADAAEAIAACLQAPLDAIAGEVFNAGGDERNYRIEQIAAIVKRVIPGLKVRIGQAGAGADYRVSFARIRRRLGFTPRRTVEEGIAEIVNAIRTGAIADVGDSRLSNLQSLRARGLPLAQTAPVSPIALSASTAPASHTAAPKP